MRSVAAGRCELLVGVMYTSLFNGFAPPHRGGPSGWRGGSRRPAEVQQRVGLVGERVGAVAGVSAVFAVRQLQPFAAAVVVELGPIQRALVEVLGADGGTAIDVLRIPLDVGTNLKTYSLRASSPE